MKRNLKVGIEVGVTIKDIAKIANVSHTTVSRALNNSPLIKENTKQKIIQIANQLNYSPDVHARSLVLQKSYTIGLFFTSISNGTSSSFLSETIKGVNTVINENYNLFIKGIQDIKDYSMITPKRFDGIILMSQSDIDNAFIYHVIEKKIPLVVLNRQIEERSVVNVLSNDQEGVYEAIQLFIKHGHRDIAIIEGTPHFKSAQERKEGYLKALMEYQLPILSEYMVKGNYNMESGYEGMKKLLSLDNYPTAVFCSNDDMAIGAMKAINEYGLMIPEDISIIGFDDIGFSEYTSPALTTVKRPIEEISIAGAEKLLQVMDAGNEEDGPIFLTTNLVRRHSVSDVKCNS
ncbi:LacI family DNA-binding transcriptional regulator [Metabacillus halosaccharovorans]|uniref:LacI family transcriptional regulator n=1 Tax=Metabacillus halosaccharovorans TaxID=930124 RepID=A0ABT3DEF8_9BACI|nr:LacI family DNA-binding transcriptional regulator [Metabacillus halosaccharovorans]MCV9885354.1 LacI family transcriptional regulator [Metabacillus halosaccharovorans]